MWARAHAHWILINETRHRTHLDGRWQQATVWPLSWQCANGLASTTQSPFRPRNAMKYLSSASSDSINLIKIKNEIIYATEASNREENIGCTDNTKCMKTCHETAHTTEKHNLLICWQPNVEQIADHCETSQLFRLFRLFIFPNFIEKTSRWTSIEQTNVRRK